MKTLNRIYRGMLIGTPLFILGGIALLSPSLINATKTISDRYVRIHEVGDDSDQQWVEQWITQNPEFAAGRFHKPLQVRIEVPGVVEPDLQDIRTSNLSPNTAVVGIVVGDDAYAFALPTMKKVTHHIVNLIVDGKPISVAYCDVVDNVRVCSDDSDQPIPLHVGGMDVDSQMVLMLDGERYDQNSEALPLTDYPFERTTLADWKQQYPVSKIFVGTEDDDAS